MNTISISEFERLMRLLVEVARSSRFADAPYTFFISGRDIHCIDADKNVFMVVRNGKPV